MLVDLFFVMSFKKTLRYRNVKINELKMFTVDYGNKYVLKYVNIKFNVKL